MRLAGTSPRPPHPWSVCQQRPLDRERVRESVSLVRPIVFPLLSSSISFSFSFACSTFPFCSSSSYLLVSFSLVLSVCLSVYWCMRRPLLRSQQQVTWHPSQGSANFEQRKNQTWRTQIKTHVGQKIVQKIGIKRFLTSVSYTHLTLPTTPYV